MRTRILATTPDRPLPLRFRLRSYLRVTPDADGSVRLTCASGPLDVPAVQGSRLLLRLLQLLQQDCSLASLAERAGLEVSVVESMARDLFDLGLLEVASDQPLTPLAAFLSRDEEDPGRLLADLNPLPVQVCGGADETSAFADLAADEGVPLAGSGRAPVLFVWLGSGQPWPVPGGSPLLLCAPAYEGRGLLGPVFTGDAAPCPECWWRRLGAHRRGRPQAREFEGLASLPLFARRLFVSHVLREVLARLLARPLALSPGAFKTLDYWSGELSLHRFLPIPDCSECCGRSAQVDDCAVTGFEGGVPGLVDPASGVFRSLQVVRMESSGVPLFSASARLGDTRALGRSWSYAVSGGMGLEASEASARALGEGLERYCASPPIPCPQEPRGWKDLDEPALSPLRLALFSQEQYARAGFPYRAPTVDAPLRWSRAFSLPGLQPILLPSALVHLPYEPDLPERPLVPAHSHGLACGRSREEAILAGLCELVERDAFTLFWQQQRPRRRVRGMTRTAGRLRGLYDEARARGWRLQIHDLRRELPVPVFLVTAKPGARGVKRTWPRFWVGAAVSPDPVRALERAFLELFQNHRYLAARPPETAAAAEGAEPCSFEDVDSFEAHALFYNRHPSLLERMPFLEEGDAVDLLDIASPVGEDPVACSELLEQHGFTVFACDLTTRDVQAAGMHVVRVVVPEMVRLHSEHALPFLGSPRLEGAQNPYPHPFP